MAEGMHRVNPPASAAFPPRPLRIFSTTQPTTLCSPRALLVLGLLGRVGQRLMPIAPGGNVGAAGQALRLTASDINRRLKTTTTTRRFRRRSLLDGAIDRPNCLLGLYKTTATYPFRRPRPAASCARGAKNSRAKTTARRRGAMSDKAGPPTSLLVRRIFLSHGREQFRVRPRSIRTR